MCVRDDAPVMSLHLVVGGLAIDAEDEIGIALLRHNVAAGNAGEGRLRQAEKLRDAPEEIQLALMHHAVGLGDVEQPVDDVFEHLRALGEEARDLARIGLEAGDVLFREVEQPRDIALLALRNLEELLEGADLVARHHAVRLRHLGGKGDHGHGKSRMPPLRRGAERGTQGFADVIDQNAGSWDPVDDIAEAAPDTHDAPQ